MQTLFVSGSILLFAAFLIVPVKQRCKLIVIAGFLLSFFIILLGVFFEKVSLAPFKGSNNRAVVGLFSADLIGAAFGALITSAVLIPYLGIVQAASGLIICKTYKPCRPFSLYKNLN